MEVSGEVAELVVKESLELTETAARLAGQGVVSAAALVAALASDQNRIVGKASVARLAKADGEAIVVPIRADDLKSFDKQAKRYGILYAAVKRRGENSGIVDILSTTSCASQINLVLESMGYAHPKPVKEDSAAKKAKSRAPRERSSAGRGNGSTPSRRNTTSEKPSVRAQLETLRAAAEQTTPHPERDKTR